MATSLGFPFTKAQWEELERQAMICKYMLASLPVPPHLLLSFPSNGGLNVRILNGTDPEPGRCRRTDGKKWRCSRDVAPYHKYCERHMHRGRPRSRKPVESVQLKNDTKNNQNNQNNIIKRTRHENQAIAQYNQTPVFVDKACVKGVDFASVASQEHRSLDWMMKGKLTPMATTDQQWLLRTHPEVGLTSADSSSIFIQQYHSQPLNLNCCSSFTAADNQQGAREHPSFLSPGHTQTPKDFIHAWSKTVSDENNKSSISSPNSLTLSMNDEMGHIHMGLGLKESNDHQNHESGINNADISDWLNPSYWVGLTPGGLLAEALRPSTVTATAGTSSNLSSSVTRNDNNNDVSSPLGVLQKTFGSDSSGSSSPTVGTSNAKGDTSLLLLNHGS